jgi:hypothetical protein
MAVRLSALRAGRSLPPRKIPGTHFCQRLSRPQGHSTAERIRSTEKIRLIGTRTSDLPTCSIVPQPTTPPRAPTSYIYIYNTYIRTNTPPYYLSIFSRFMETRFKILYFLHFYTFFGGKTFEYTTKIDQFCLHIQQYMAIYLWLCMYTPDDGQPRPKHVVFNIINWLKFNSVAYYIQHNQRVVWRHKNTENFLPDFISLFTHDPTIRHYVSELHTASLHVTWVNE